MNQVIKRINIRTLWWLIVPGVALLSVGYFGDRLGWWQSLSYSSNILAGATTACFGVPIAATVVQQLLRKEDENRNRRQLTRSTSRLIDSMRGELDKMLNGHGAELQEQLGLVIREVRMLGLEYPDITRAGIQRLYRVRTALKDLMSSVHEVFLHSAGGIRWTSIVDRWNVIVDNLLVQAVVEDLDLIPDPFRSEIESCIVIEKRNFPDFHDCYSLLEYDYLDNIDSLSNQDLSVSEEAVTDYLGRIQVTYDSLKRVNEHFANMLRLQAELTATRTGVERRGVS